MGLTSLVHGVKNTLTGIQNYISTYQVGKRRIENSFDQFTNSFSYAWSMPLSYHINNRFADVVDVSDKLVDVVREYKVYTDSFDHGPIYEYLDIFEGRKRSQGIWSWDDRINEFQKTYSMRNLSPAQKDLLRESLRKKEYFKKKHAKLYGQVMASLV